MPCRPAGPLVRLLDAERAHQVGIMAARLGLFPRETRPDPPSLRTTVWGREFPNPLGERLCKRVCVCVCVCKGGVSLQALHCSTCPALRCAAVQPVQKADFDCLPPCAHVSNIWLLTRCPAAVRRRGCRL
jgi:hypothetical protein